MNSVAVASFHHRLEFVGVKLMFQLKQREVEIGEKIKLDMLVEAAESQSENVDFERSN
jgi:hypothetical protein